MAGSAVKEGPPAGGALDLAVVIKRFVTTGGAERYAVETSRYLHRQGHRVALYARETEPAAAEGLTLHRVPARRRFSSVVDSVFFARDAARLLAGCRYDAIISHERGFCQDLAVVHTFSYRQSLSGYGWLRRIDQHYLSPRAWLHLYLERAQMQSAWLVAVSETVRQGIARFYGRRRQVQVVTPGVDSLYFAPEPIETARRAQRRRIGAEPGEMVVLFVGSEFRRKGLDDLLPAIGPGMRLVVVGTGERLSHYRRRVCRLGLDGRVLFAGMAGDVRPWYAAADVLVLPSRAEAFGMSVLEAMACGRAVVVRRRAGVAALIDTAVNGWAYEAPAELADALQRLTDADLRRRLGLAARRTAATLSWEAAGAALERLCHQVTAGRRPGR